MVNIAYEKRRKDCYEIVNLIEIEIGIGICN